MSEPPTDAPLMLSVSGARGIVGKSMTPDVAARFARAFAAILRERSGSDGGGVVLARDSRPGGEELARAAGEALCEAGFNVFDLGIAMTPTAGVMIDELAAAGGMVVTASHNPIEWNGLKCLVAPGVAPPAEVAERIIERFQNGSNEYPLPPGEGRVRVKDSERGTITTRSDATDRHLARVLDAIDPQPIRQRHFKVVLDSVNGAGCVGGRKMLEQLGCEVMHLNSEPTGCFAHLPEPTKENLTSLCGAVREQRADIGFAQDPDGDRLAIVDERGRYIGEEYTLVLAAKRVLDRDGGGVLAANLSTSRMIDDLAARYPGTAVLRTAVGEANVAAAMMNPLPLGEGRVRASQENPLPLGEGSVRAKESPLRLGGEGNGGVIYPPVTWVRDSLSAMALVLGLMAGDDHTISGIVDALPRYVMIKRKFDLAEMGGRDAIPGFLEKVKQQFANERIKDADGVRIDFDDGWVHLRTSNTEPIVRLIAEGEDEAAVEKLIATIEASRIRGGGGAARY